MRSPEEVRQAYHLHCENLRSALTRVANTQFEIIVDLVLRDETELQDTFCGRQAECAVIQPE